VAPVQDGVVFDVIEEAMVDAFYETLSGSFYDIAPVGDAIIVFVVFIVDINRFCQVRHAAGDESKWILVDCCSLVRFRFVMRRSIESLGNPPYVAARP